MFLDLVLFLSVCFNEYTLWFIDLLNTINTYARTHTSHMYWMLRAFELRLDRQTSIEQSYNRTSHFVPNNLCYVTHLYLLLYFRTHSRLIYDWIIKFIRISRLKAIAQQKLVQKSVFCYEYSKLWTVPKHFCLAEFWLFELLSFNRCRWWNDSKTNRDVNRV